MSREGKQVIKFTKTSNHWLLILSKRDNGFVINMQYLQGLHCMILWLDVRTSTFPTAFIVFKIKSVSFSVI